MDRATWLITGASSGLGYALAEHVLEQGDQVVAAARTLEPMAAPTERYPDAGLAVTLDVTDPQQRADAISQAEARFGAIDILVNDAGIDFIGAIEEQDEKDYRAQFEVNFFAAAALLRQALGDSRQRRPPANRRETRHAARRVRDRQRARVQHRLPRRYRANRALGIG